MILSKIPASPTIGACACVVLTLVLAPHRCFQANCLAHVIRFSCLLDCCAPYVGCTPTAFLQHCGVLTFGAHNQRSVCQLLVFVRCFVFGKLWRCGSGCEAQCGSDQFLRVIVMNWFHSQSGQCICVYSSSRWARVLAFPSSLCCCGGVKNRQYSHNLLSQCFVSCALTIFTAM